MMSVSSVSWGFFALHYKHLWTSFTSGRQIHGSRNYHSTFTSLPLSLNPNLLNVPEQAKLKHCIFSCHNTLEKETPFPTVSSAFFQNLKLGGKNGKTNTVTTTESFSEEEWLQEIRKCQPHVIRSSFKINWSVTVWGWRRPPESLSPRCFMSYPHSFKGSWSQNTLLLNISTLIFFCPFKREIRLFSVYGCFCLHMCVYLMCACCLHRPKRVSDTLEQELDFSEPSCDSCFFFLKFDF